MKGDAAIASAAIAATDREIHVIIRGNYHDAPSMQQRKRDDLRELGLSLGHGNLSQILVILWPRFMLACIPRSLIIFNLLRKNFILGSNKIHPNELIDVLKQTAARNHVTTKYEYRAFTYRRLCNGIERIFDPHFLQPTNRLHMLSTAMTNDVVGGGGILTPAPPFKNVGFSLAGYSVM